MSILTRNILISLVITIVIAGTIAYAVNYLNTQRVDQLNDIENQLSTDTLSIETQYSLLEDAPCSDFVSSSSTTESTSLSQEVNDLGDKLSYEENTLNSDDPQLTQLKDQYTLLEIRDYLLTKQIAATCHVKPTIVLYFYSNVPDECTDCGRAGTALSYLRQTYPSLRVYSFDYNLNLAALNTLESLENIKQPFPAFVINGVEYNGFTSLADLENDFPKGVLATSTRK